TLGALVERLAEFHDVDAVLAERGTDGRRGIGLTRGTVKLDGCLDLFCHYIFSTCQYSSSTGVVRPKMATSTFSLPLLGLTSSILPLKLTNGPSFTRTLSPFSKMTFGVGFSFFSSACL